MQTDPFEPFFRPVWESIPQDFSDTETQNNNSLAIVGICHAEINTLLVRPRVCVCVCSAMGGKDQG